MSPVAKVYIVYYSAYGHIYKLAKAIEEGANTVDGVEVTLYQVPETLPAEVLEKMHAAPKDGAVPEIAADKLPEADGLLFGFPTRFGSAPAQVNALLDATGGLWASGALRGKQAGTFFASNSQHGGQETTAFTLVTYFAHHALQYVPFGYGHPGLMQAKELVGGGPYGAGVLAGVEGDSPTKLELEIGRAQGKYFAEQVLIRKLGEEALKQKA